MDNLCKLKRQLALHLAKHVVVGEWTFEYTKHRFSSVSDPEYAKTINELIYVLDWMSSGDRLIERAVAHGIAHSGRILSNCIFSYPIRDGKCQVEEFENGCGIELGLEDDGRLLLSVSIFLNVFTSTVAVPCGAPEKSGGKLDMPFCAQINRKRLEASFGKANALGWRIEEDFSDEMAGITDWGFAEDAFSLSINRD